MKYSVHKKGFLLLELLVAIAISISIGAVVTHLIAYTFVKNRHVQKKIKRLFFLQTTHPLSSSFCTLKKRTHRMHPLAFHNKDAQKTGLSVITLQEKEASASHTYYWYAYDTQ